MILNKSMLSVLISKIMFSWLNINILGTSLLRGKSISKLGGIYEKRFTFLAVFVFILIGLTTNVSTTSANNGFEGISNNYINDNMKIDHIIIY